MPSFKQLNYALPAENTLIQEFNTIVILYLQSFPSSATTLHFEFYVENKDEKGSKKVCFFFQEFQDTYISCAMLWFIFSRNCIIQIFLLTEYCKHNNFHTYGEFG